MLSKDFGSKDSPNEARMLYSNDNNEMSILMNMFKNLSYGKSLQDYPNQTNQFFSKDLGKNKQNPPSKSGAKALKNKVSEPFFKNFSANSSLREKGLQFTQQFFDKISTKTDNSNVISPLGQNSISSIQSDSLGSLEKKKKNHLDVYSPFRLLANFAAQDYNFKDLNPNLLLTNNTDSSLLNSSKIKLLELFNTTLQNKAAVKDPIGQSLLSQKISQEYGGQKFNAGSQNTMPKLVNSLAQKNFLEKSLTSENLLKSSEKGLSQRILRKEYAQDKNTIGSSWSSSFNNANSGSLKSLNYLDFYSYKDSYNEFKGAQRSSGGRQADKTLQEEEAKKVFVIINSFGGSVGNGITVHDALQFIKAGSLTLGLGVAASAASLALAGGTIGERYVTEGCHVMIHQPEGGIQGQASDIWIDSQEIMKIRLDVAEIYSLATYRPRHKILRDLDRDFYLTATETIHYGLADEIATNEVMHEIIEMTSKVWDYHDSKQQRLLESRESSNSGLDTQAQN
jgi:ATP-dependent Clp protease protease subunit